ncbi:MAG: hypothetical protein ACPGXX_00330, partial [Planctomycetaceae bacterium]
MAGTGLERKLAVVASRLMRLRIFRRQTVIWLGLILPGGLLAMFLPTQLGGFPTELILLLLIISLGTVFAKYLTGPPSLNEVARVVEQRDEELQDAVITAAELLQRPRGSAGVLGQMTLENADNLVARRDLSQSVPSWQLRWWAGLSVVSFALLFSSVMAAGRYGRQLREAAELNGQAAGSAAIAELEDQLDIQVEPGDTELEQGAALTVVARLSGVIPEQVVLEYQSLKQPEPRLLTMSETIDEGVFAARMEQITASGTYRVRIQPRDSRFEQSSEDYNVSTYVRPALIQADADLTPPSWSGQPAETIEDVARVTVTEGSDVRFRLQLNKPVAVAELRAEDEPPIALVADAADQSVVSVELKMLKSQKWTLFLQDEDGREPIDEDRLSVTVLKNQPAAVKPVFPSADTNVSSLQEFMVEGLASDDFGLVDYGIEYSLSGGEPREVSLRPLNAEPTDNQNPPAEVEASLSSLIDLEAMQAAPDDLVTWSFWAVDLAADGQPRKSTSDLMFAEVRRFEEIFREAQQGGQQGGQQSGQQSGQQGGAAENLLRLQKEITTATWNVTRSAGERAEAGTLSEDVQTILESQQEALQQLQNPESETAADPAVAQLGQRAAEEMSAVIDSLSSALESDTEQKLSEALPQEQQVIRTLLQMRAAEARVQEQQQGGGGGGGGGSSSARQQMQQLELDNDRNRYESEQQARQQEAGQQREELQVLNRLRELSQRQQVLNERLKQLESELRLADSDQERDEIERELKRLRDEQREMLRDVDELNERMQQQEQTAQSQQSENRQFRDQLQEARQNLQNSSRAMDEGRLAEAISEGTRAERQFDDLKEEFRNQTSSRFEEAVRDLRQQARELNTQQEDLARELAGNGEVTEENQRPSLRSTQDREGVEEAIQQQQDRLQQVLEESRELVEAAESSEPLLSERLYQTLREVRDLKPEEALEAAEMLAGRGLWPQTQEAEQVARQGLQRLQEGIEDAADAVLGSEAESLRRAQEELRDATERLSEEVRDAAGGEQNPADGEGLQGQPGYEPEQSENSDGQQGEGQQGEGQQGEGQQGEGQQG